MKKTVLLLALVLPLFLNAQLTSDDFESYSEGAFDSQWTAGEWESWNSNPSNALISTDQSYSGSKSLLIQNANGPSALLGILGVLNSDIHEISFMQYVPANTGGDYIFLHNYPNSNSAASWFSFGQTSLSGGEIYADGNITHFPTVYDQWVENRFVFNFISDVAKFYYNNTLIQSWKISTTWNGNSAPLQITRIDFEGYCTVSSCTNQTYYDDISLVAIPVPEFDISMTKGKQPSEYTMVPYGHVQPFIFEAKVANEGAQTISNVEVTANVLDSSNNSVYMESLGTVLNLPSGASSTFYFESTFTPSEIGDYTIEYTATIDETDTNPDNDYSDAIVFAVTDSVYARDDGNYSSSSAYGWNNLNAFIGQRFDFIEDASVKSIALSYIGTGIGDEIVGHIYSTDSSNSPDALIATTDLFVLETAGSIGAAVPVSLIFPSPVILPAGNYVFMVEQKITSDFYVSTSTKIFTPGSTWISTNNGATWQSADSEELALNIRPILDETFVGVEKPSYVESFTLSPNPSNGKATVFLELAETKDLTLEVFNLQGELVHIIQDYNVKGSAQYNLDLTTLLDGIYIVSLTIDYQVASCKMNLTK